MTIFSDIWLPIYHAIISKFMDDPVVIIQNRTEAALFGGVTSVSLSRVFSHVTCFSKCHHVFLEISRAFFRFVARITHIYLRLFSCSN